MSCIEKKSEVRSVRELSDSGKVPVRPAARMSRVCTRVEVHCIPEAVQAMMLASFHGLEAKVFRPGIASAILEQAVTSPGTRAALD